MSQKYRKLRGNNPLMEKMEKILVYIVFSIKMRVTIGILKTVKDTDLVE